MQKYAATINAPGYLPDSAEPAPTFDSVGEAWQFLADERRKFEDDKDSAREGTGELPLTGAASYSEAHLHMEQLAAYAGTDKPVAWKQGSDLDITGLGTVYAYDEDDDPDTAYSVEIVEVEDPQIMLRLTFPDLSNEEGPMFMGGPEIVALLPALSKREAEDSLGCESCQEKGHAGVYGDCFTCLYCTLSIPGIKVEYITPEEAK